MKHFSLIDLILHLDVHLRELIRVCGPYIYLVLFSTIFIETGFVVTPFLPGDSLLFTAGLLARPENEGMNITLLLLTLPNAAVLGDLVNFHIGKFFGKILYKTDDTGILKHKHLLKTREFFETHGPKAIIIGRFVPVIRTVAPFVAGMDGMPLKWFFPLSVIAAIAWVFLCTGAGFLLGGIPFVHEHFGMVLIGVVLASTAIFFVEALRHRMKPKPVKEVPDAGVVEASSEASLH